MSFDAEKMAGAVLGNAGGAYIAGHFRLDTINYSWVKEYRRDQDIRSEIEDLKKKMIDAGKLPIHKDELRAQFESKVKQINEFRIRQISAHLSSVQKREEPFIYSEGCIGERRILDAPYLPYLIDLSSSDIDAIFSEIAEGVSQKSIDKTTEDCRKRIEELESTIAKELSPKSRWLHRDTAEPLSYPTGCRWKAFSDTWKKIQARFSGPVNINGYGLKTEGEFMAHHVLKIDQVTKLTPLRDPCGRDNL